MAYCPPLDVLSNMEHKYPGCWAKLETIREHKAPADDGWDDLRYVSIADTISVISSYPGAETNVYMENDAVFMTALATWRQDKRIYRWPEALTTKLVTVGEDHGIPMEELHRLPSACVYMELKSGPMPEGAIGTVGFFAHVDSGDEHLQLMLDILLSDLSCMPMGIEIVPGGTIRDGLVELYRQIRNDGDYEDPTGYIDYHYKLVTGLTQIILYLCAHEDWFVPDPEQEKIYRAPKAPAFIKDRFREVRVWDYTGPDL